MLNTKNLYKQYQMKVLNKTTKDYPRLLSLSTIGLKKHLNVDYIFHPLRTDFIGDSGVGKSLIADLLQLIFVGHKYYVSATADKPKGEDRPISGMLHTTQAYGYAWIQIEKKAKQYFAVGIFLEKDNEVTHFIIHAGQDKNNIEYYDKFLGFDDFLKNEDLYSLKDGKRLKQHLNSLGYRLHDFRNRSDYHKLLAENAILPLDLTEENKVKIYANILQTLSRAKKISTESEDLKNFLFDKEEIEKLRKDFAEMQNDLMVVYSQNKQNKIIAKELEDKYTKLQDLEKEENSYLKEYEQYLIKKLKYEDYHFQIAEKDEKNAETEFNQFSLQKLILEKLVEMNTNTELKEKLSLFDANRKQLKNIKKKLKHVHKKMRRLAKNKAKIEQTWQEKRKLHSKVIEIEDLLKVINGDLNMLKERYQNQTKNKSEKGDLMAFVEILQKEKVTALFEKSEYFSDIENALKNYLGKVESIKAEISHFEALQKFTDINNKDSLCYWILNEHKQALSKAEECVVLTFQSLMRNMPEKGEKGNRFLPQPKELFLAIKDSLLNRDNIQDNGFWLNLAGIYEFIPYKKEGETYIFGNFNQDLQAKMTEMAKNIEIDLAKSKQTLSELQQIHSIITTNPKLTNISHYISLYKRKEEINTFEVLTPLSISQEEFDSLLLAYRDMENAKRVHENYKKTEKAMKKVQLLVIENEIIIEKGKGEKETLLNFFKENNNKDFLQREVQKSDSYLKEKDIKITEAAGLNFSIEQEEKNVLANTRTIISINDNLESIKKQQEEHTAKKKKHSEQKEADIKSYLKHTKQETCDIEFLKPEEYSINKKPKDEPTRDYIDNLKTNYQGSFKGLATIYIGNKDQAASLCQDYSIESLAKSIFPEDVFKYKDRIDEDFMIQLSEGIKRVIEKNEGLNKGKWDALPSFFQKILALYSKYERQIKAISKFLEQPSAIITGENRAYLTFRPHTIYKKSFLENLGEMEGLFKSLENTKDTIKEQVEYIIKQELLDTGVSINIEKLIHPFSYFDLEFYMKPPTGEKNIGSTGQKFTKIALLCMARMSVIETEMESRQIKVDNPRIKEGLRFIPIDEAEGLGSNYEMLRDLAIEKDYQIISFTPGYLGYENQEHYVYELQEGEDGINGSYFGTFYDNNITALSDILTYHNGK